MAIDARIKAIDIDGKDLILTLEPRIDEGGIQSIAGRDTFTIKEFQYAPEVGDEIWGGDTTVHIERKNKRLALHYRRIGYSELREDFDLAMKSPQSPRFA